MQDTQYHVNNGRSLFDDRMHCYIEMLTSSIYESKSVVSISIYLAHNAIVDISYYCYHYYYY